MKMKFDLKKKIKVIKKTSLEIWDILIVKIIKKPKTRKDVLLRDFFWISFGLFLIFGWIKIKSPKTINFFSNPINFLSISTIILFFQLKNSIRKTSLINFFFYANLLILSILNIFHTTFTKEFLLNLPLPFNLFPLIIQIFVPNLIFITVVLGFFVFKKNFNKKKVIKVIKKNPFNKHQWKYLIALFLLVILGFGLRIYNLDHLSPVRDEYYHLNAAKHILQDGTFNYSRAKIITYSTFWFWKVFNNGESSLFWARLISVILGSLAIPLTYYLAKIISNQKIALISAFLLAISPFHIGMSRYLREYILFFDLLIITLIFIVLSYQSFLAKKYKKGIALFILLIPIISYRFLDKDSTYILNIVIASFFSIMLLLQISWKNKKFLFEKFSNIPKIYKRAIITGALILFFLLFYSLSIKFIENNTNVKLHTPNISWVNKFLDPNKPYQWFYNSFYSLSFILIFTSLGIVKKFKNIFYRTSLFTFLSILILYILFFNRYDEFRYAFQLQLFFTFLMACSIYEFLRINNKGLLKKIILVFFVITTFNLSSTINLLTKEENGDKSNMTKLIHRDVDALFTKMHNLNFNIHKDSLIAYDYPEFVYNYDYQFVEKESLAEYNFDNPSNVDTGAIYKIHPCEENFVEKISAITQKKSRGFFIAHKDKNQKQDSNELCIEPENLKVYETTLEYLGESSSDSKGFYIFRWK